MRRTTFLAREEALLEQICELVLASDIRCERTPLQWLSDLLYMHKRGWLYCSMKGTELMGVAGAFRIPEWREQYRNELPEREEGRLLYMPFLVSKEKLSSVPLRLVRYCLRENKIAEEVLYDKRRPGELFQTHFVLVRKNFWKKTKAPELIPPADELESLAASRASSELIEAHCH